MSIYDYVDENGVMTFNNCKIKGEIFKPMAKVILKDARILKEVLKDIFQKTNCSSYVIQQQIYEKIDQAFAEEEERPWEPEFGKNVWFVDLLLQRIGHAKYSKTDEWEQIYRSGLTFPSFLTAQQFLKDYKTFLSERVKNK